METRMIWEGYSAEMEKLYFFIAEKVWPVTLYGATTETAIYFRTTRAA